MILIPPAHSSAYKPRTARMRSTCALRAGSSDSVRRMPRPLRAIVAVIVARVPQPSARFMTPDITTRRTRCLGVQYYPESIVLSRIEWSVLIVCVFAICIGVYFGKTSEVVVMVTAVYVFLVYLQLRISRRQLDELVQDRAARLRAEKDREPRLDMLPPMVRETPEAEEVGGKPRGQAYYVNCLVVNRGGSVSRNSQPLLTAAARRTADGRWSRFENWIPLELRWCLDEIATKGGNPTRERGLVPARQYQFDLCTVSPWRPDPKLEIVCLSRPFAQPTSFDFGEYCFEVKVFSENAAACAAWCLVTYRADTRTGYPVTIRQTEISPWDI